MNNYELVFLVDVIDEQTEMRLIEELDAMVEERDGQTLIALNVVGSDAFTAGQTMTADLKSRKVEVKRMDLDLVTRAGVADRTGVSRTTVGNWVARGHCSDPFPQPHTWVGGPVWSWSEVNEWLRRTGAAAKYDSYCSPNPLDVARFNAWLDEQRFSAVRNVSATLGESQRQVLGVPSPWVEGKLREPV